MTDVGLAVDLGKITGDDATIHQSNFQLPSPTKAVRPDIISDLLWDAKDLSTATAPASR